MYLNELTVFVSKQGEPWWSVPEVAELICADARDVQSVWRVKQRIWAWWSGRDWIQQLMDGAGLIACCEELGGIDPADATDYVMAEIERNKIRKGA